MKSTFIKSIFSLKCVQIVGPSNLYGTCDADRITVLKLLIKKNVGVVQKLFFNCFDNKKPILH